MKPYFLNFDFKGRSRRSHTWANLGLWLATLLVLSLLAGFIPPLFIALFLVLIVAAIDQLAMYFRRSHDTGKSGWIVILLIVPIINLLPLYWFYIEDSNAGPNKYGPPTKQFYTDVEKAAN